MKFIIHLYISVFVSVYYGICLAADKVEIECPKTIKIDQRVTTPLSKEWNVNYNSSPHLLESVTFFNGLPKEMVALAPQDSSPAKGGIEVYKWNLPQDPKGYWIECAYTETHTKLFRPLPSTVNTCSVYYYINLYFPSGLPAIEKIECFTAKQ